MLLAYIDEIGEPGPYVAKDHPRFNTNPVFGYAGFVGYVAERVDTAGRVTLCLPSRGVARALL